MNGNGEAANTPGEAGDARVRAFGDAVEEITRVIMAAREKSTVPPAAAKGGAAPAPLLYERGCQEETSPPTPDAFLLHRSPCTGSAWRRPGLVMVMSRTARVPWVRTWLVSTMLLLGTRGPLHALVVRGGICSAKGLDLMSGQEGT